MSCSLHKDSCKPGTDALYVVTIAGSAGAFAPLHAFLAALPIDFPAAVITMLHTGPQSALADALTPRTRLPISYAQTGQHLRSGNVYVPQGGDHVIVNPDATLSVSRDPCARRFRPSADWLFESAAASFCECHVAVVLSGILSDGARALGAVKRLGGHVLAQLPGECAYPDMPEAAIATGNVDEVVGVGEMPGAIAEMLARRDAERDLARWIAPFGTALGRA